MRINAYRALRISLAAAAMLLLFAEAGFTTQTYTVRKGDTLYGIAKKFGVSLADLQSANGLHSSSVKTGRTLSIPSKASDPVVYGCSTRDHLPVEGSDGIMTVLDQDTRFVVLAREGDKYNIRLTDGKTGWVNADAVTLDDTRKPIAVSDTWGFKRSVVATAYSCRGARYRSGGSSLGGFDCSGFVKYVFASAGISLPHDSRAMFNYGTAVEKQDLQPGDVVFFENTYRRGISHVGVYVGDGKFIHASTYRTGVRVDDLDAVYFRNRYYGARRI